MTKQELAAELYELIVNRGRWKGRPPADSVMGNEYHDLPAFAQDLWLAKAVEFAAENRFTLED